MIREATLGDIPALVSLSSLFCSSVGLDKHFNRSHAANHLEYLRNNGILLVLEQDEAVVGVIAGIGSVSPWNPTVTVFEEQMYYIKKEYRDTKWSYKLLKEYTDKITTQYSTLKTMFNSPDLSNVYGRLGYTHLETTYIRRL